MWLARGENPLRFSTVSSEAKLAFREESLLYFTLKKIKKDVGENLFNNFEHQHTGSLSACTMVASLKSWEPVLGATSLGISLQVSPSAKRQRAYKRPPGLHRILLLSCRNDVAWPGLFLVGKARDPGAIDDHDFIEEMFSYVAVRVLMDFLSLVDHPGILHLPQWLL
ncbi:unnamed protein product [Schistocephalus solidus]|uniref:Uncharacterized protein n=1 Tax=Schistocephalus solidus TaxID=70667 RepID=A0A183SLQ5_SCHSO|nr:unnamed protein product [Schistocephalus solidus]